MPDLDAMRLASCYVGTDSMAENIVVTLVLADVRDTVVEVGLRVNGLVTLLERPVLPGEDCTVLLSLVGLLLCFFAHRAIAGASIHTARDLAYFPALCKLDGVGCPAPILHDQIVTRFPIVVAAESTNGVEIGIGNSDTYQPVPAKGYGQIELGGDEDMGSADVGPYLIFMVERQVHE